ncbi:hypothetical protein [Mycoplasma seminis]|uniref:Uncharacterized protein n=1 Tax=Mycoplasma seminis TaxID=512749 RepID=A0ABY9H9J6_9MOLU|nr:hypothetical protein [Mycoplasma seminis]WLP85249.1 hypothetical protein Q8852_02915 [Mycoplasma seminis]
MFSIITKREKEIFTDSFQNNYLPKLIDEQLLERYKFFDGERVAKQIAIDFNLSKRKAEKLNWQIKGISQTLNSLVLRQPDVSYNKTKKFIHKNILAALESIYSYKMLFD